MKNHKAIYVLQYILVLGLYRNAYAQRGNYNYKTVRRNNNDCPSGISMSLGASHYFCDNTGFNAWANNVYHKSILQNPLGAALDITFVENRYDVGFRFIGNQPCGIMTFFAGTNLCRKPHFRSFLNAEVGVYEVEVHHTVPPNYVPTFAQQINDSYLRYQTGCVGLSLKNMFVSHPNKNGTSFISSIDVQFDYMPFKGEWEYGYLYKTGTHSSHFNGNPVSGIPAPSNMYFSVTYSIGFLVGTASHNR
jgi:hypothetical protein